MQLKFPGNVTLYKGTALLQPLHRTNCSATIALRRLHCNNCSATIALQQLHLKTVPGADPSSASSFEEHFQYQFSINWNICY